MMHPPESVIEAQKLLYETSIYLAKEVLPWLLLFFVVVAALSFVANFVNRKER